MLAAIGQDLLRTALLGQLLLLVLLLDALEPALTRGADCAPTTSIQSSAANTVRRQRARPRGQRSERRDNGLGMGSRVAHGGPPSPCRRRPAREPWPTSPGPAGGTCCAPTASRALRAPVPISSRRRLPSAYCIPGAAPRVIAAIAIVSLFFPMPRDAVTLPLVDSIRKLGMNLVATSLARQDKTQHQQCAELAGNEGRMSSIV